jgi:putative transposase
LTGEPTKRIDFSRPSKPTDNAFIETFNGTRQDECLNSHQIGSRKDTKQVIDVWRIDYNDNRPHTTLGNETHPEYYLYATPRRKHKAKG